MPPSRRQLLCASLACGAAALARSARAISPRLPPSRTRLRFEPFELQLKHAWTLSRNSSTVKRNFLVELTCDGLTGRGEAAPNVRFHETPESAARDLQIAAQVIAPLHPGRRRALLAALDAALPQAPSVRCAVDMALWDWQCQALKVPLWRYLGLDPAAAPLTSFSLSIAGKDTLQKKVAEARDFPLLKVKLGAQPKDGITDREIVETILRAAPGKRLRVDPNEGWTAQSAPDLLRWLVGLQPPGVIELCEQPLPAADLPALRALFQRRLGLPILLDESVLRAGEIPPLQGAADGVVIKLQKAGGVSGALEQITVARALGLKVMIGCMIESALGITAAAHLAPLCDFADLDGNLLVANDPFRGVRVDHGRLLLPPETTHGLGVTRA